MMQRWCWRFRSMAALASSNQLHHLRPSPVSRLIHTSPNLFHKPPIITRSLIAPDFSSHISASAFPSPISQSPHSLIQVRYITAKQRKRKLKSRKPMTPVVSKVKKVKIKGYSSYKGRFRLMNDGQIRRWKEGKRHNAFSKSKKSKRRLRQPGIVPAAYAKVMKKLNFCA
ncbi:uncharacterized protein LOC125213580 isoform X1 [Salvia hispanica]|uniref:uncharacterized protein LOC125213580 isoform X1 n=1 Tax=Salvia hispanica TaxID=49212 RepID=UPI0020095B40|nr:uncharacterized protein LOC125213580 isoform X1 [Salvia hispanica]